MSSFDVQTAAEQPGQQGGLDATAPGQSPSSIPPLPPTALQMQMSAMTQGQQRQQGAGMQAYGAGMTTGGPSFINPMGRSSTAGRQYDTARLGIRDMAEQLARNYGINFAEGTLVDPQGNFRQNPEQLAALQGGAGAQGMDMASIAESMNYVADAINQRQLEQQQNKAGAALQTGLGLVQERGRGSLAAMQSNFFQSMAAVYTDPNLLPDQADFSYWIARDREEEADLNREREDKVTGGNTTGGAATSGPGASSPSTKPGPYSQYSGNAGSTDFYKEGKGDIVTTGPHAGQRPVYTYDPINKMTTVTWETP